jgi:repressor LexA
MKDLTVKQKTVLNAIKEFIDRNSFPPTCQELKNMLGYSSANSITGYLDLIEKKGYIKRTPNIARSIVVL